VESARIQQVQTPVIPVLGQWIKANPGTISLGQGVVYYSPPKESIDCMIKNLSEPDIHKYKLAEGIDPLLRLIENKLDTENGIKIDPEKNAVFVTAGANMAFYNLLFAIADPGDEIILLSPYYFNYEMAISIAGCKTVTVSTDSNYQPDIDAIKKAVNSKTKAIVTISPNNPTGVVYDRDILTEINNLCRDNNIYHICDEAYEYFTYGKTEHFSPGSIIDSESYTVSIYSLSKAYGMASWRIGYLVLPKHLEMAFKKIQDTNVICAPVASQYAGVGAMRIGNKYCREHLISIKNVRKLVLSQLNSIGDIISYSYPDGAFYILIRINNTNLTSMEFVRKMIFEHKVALVPGSTFGIEDGCYVRLAYGALKKETAAEGIGRFIDGLNSLS
jgi:aspartate/methionine/tyrosine aminotransferase